MLRRIEEADGMLPEGLRFTAIRLGRQRRTYEVITSGINDGSKVNGEPNIKVLVGRLDESNHVEDGHIHLVPQDLLISALLLGKHIFRGYRIIPIDQKPDRHGAAIQALLDQTGTILAQERRRLLGA